MKVIETKLDELLVKKAPYQLPENFKKSLAKVLPWLALLGGVLSLLSAWGVYEALSWAGSLMSMTNELGAYGYYGGYSAAYGPMLWLSVALLVAEAVLFFMAFSPLKAYKKRGWDMLFWLSLINVVYTVFSLIVTPNVMQFLVSIIGSVIGLYLLFQVRSRFVSSATKKS